MSEMREKVMQLRWWALNHAVDVLNRRGDCPSKDDIWVVGQLVDVVKDTHTIEELAMDNAETAMRAQARMCGETHPGFGREAAHYDHAEHHKDMAGAAKA